MKTTRNFSTNKKVFFDLIKRAARTLVPTGRKISARPIRAGCSDTQTRSHISANVVAKHGGIELIADERARQIASEGWTAAHDDSHTKQELLRAGVCYAMHEVDNPGYANAAIDEWPWSMDWYKPGAEPIRNLVKAGALIAAEIDRLQRLQLNKAAGIINTTKE